MHTLVIMRHAKAEKGDGKPDFDRALEPRGVSEAGAVGAKLAGLGIHFDRILCSTSRRTRDTLAALLPHFPGDATVSLSRALYEAEVEDLRELVGRADGDSVLLIGHNPSVHGLALALAQRSPDARALAGSFPTSTAAVFTVGADLGSARFGRLVAP